MPPPWKGQPGQAKAEVAQLAADPSLVRPSQGRSPAVVIVGQLVLQGAQGAVDQATIARQTPRDGAGRQLPPLSAAQPDSADQKQREQHQQCNMGPTGQQGRYFQQRHGRKQT